MWCVGAWSETPLTLTQGFLSLSFMLVPIKYLCLCMSLWLKTDLTYSPSFVMHVFTKYFNQIYMYRSALSNHDKIDKFWNNKTPKSKKTFNYKIVNICFLNKRLMDTIAHIFLNLKCTYIYGVCFALFKIVESIFIQLPCEKIFLFC